MKLFIGGILIGLANLIPGVSGGTLAVLCGIYEKLINSVSDIFKLKFSKSAIMILIIVSLGMITAIIFGSSFFKYSVENYPFYTYSLFWGLLLGSVPELKKRTASIKYFPLIIGILLVVLPKFIQSGSENRSYVLFLLGGILGGGAMVLPGLSGSLMLLVIGIYKIVVLDTIVNFKELIKEILTNFIETKDFNVLVSFITNNSELFALLKIIIPFGIGIIIGIIAFSLLMKWAFAKYHLITANIIFGLIIGSLYPIFPYQEQYRYSEGNIFIAVLIIIITAAASYKVFNNKNTDTDSVNNT